MSGAPSRRGSETRQRQACVKVRLSAGEAEQVERLVANTGHTAAALARHSLLSIPLPRKRPQPRTDGMAVGRLLGHIQELRGEFGKVGSNLNQIAFHLNARDEYLAQDVRSGLTDLDVAIQTLLEVRGACLKALGVEDHDEEL